MQYKKLDYRIIYDKLDIEFAVDNNDVIHIFQVRPLTVNHSNYEYNFKKFLMRPLKKMGLVV